MYILVVGGGFPTGKYPGNGIFEFDQAKALAEYGHKVVYCAIDLRSIRRWRRWGCDSFAVDGVEVYRYSVPLGRVNSKVLDWFGEKCFASMYRKIVKRFGKPDIVHAHFGDVAMYIDEYCKNNDITFVITEHSSSVNKPTIDPDYAKRLRKAYLNSDKLIAVSSKLKDSIKRHTGVDSAVIFDMLATEGFTEHRRKREEGMPFVFLSSGSLIQSKGFDLLLKAFTRLCERHDDIELKIMGSGSEETALKTMAEELGITTKVSFTGKYVRNEFDDALGNADCFVLASRGETFGVVYIEAMAAGVPIIATECGGPEDFVTPEVGILIPTESVDDLIFAMEKMYLEFDKYDSEKIRDYATNMFSPNRIAVQLMEAYREIVH